MDGCKVAIRVVFVDMLVRRLIQSQTWIEVW
jgi:hypothetical protein